ncbi:hypothetical protein CDAR_599961 [Caerostris darwini]|uniref:Uncharacterized protein n=1 Tax=Caerostris darwini TaxID=1538125 RepID=A0AAV4RQZ0_9ARAC|nr:hypothetical protein CDAR_599961 [Caerostris darwini]
MSHKFYLIDFRSSFTSETPSLVTDDNTLLGKENMVDVRALLGTETMTDISNPLSTGDMTDVSTPWSMDNMTFSASLKEGCFITHREICCTSIYMHVCGIK